jgi:hypothetical protein
MKNTSWQRGAALMDAFQASMDMELLAIAATRGLLVTHLVIKMPAMRT